MMKLNRRWMINYSTTSMKMLWWKHLTASWLSSRPMVMLFMFRRIFTNTLAFSRYVDEDCNYHQQQHLLLKKSIFLLFLISVFSFKTIFNNFLFGYFQIEIIGNPIWDYTHQCDHTELRDTLKAHAEDQKKNSELSHRNVLIRIKCTLTSRGRSVNIKSATYKVSIDLIHHSIFIYDNGFLTNKSISELQVINIEGHIVLDETKNHHQFVGIARLIPHPSNIEVPLGSKTFLSKHSLNMKFAYVDDKYVQQFFFSLLFSNEHFVLGMLVDFSSKNLTYSHMFDTGRSTNGMPARPQLKLIDFTNNFDFLYFGFVFVECCQFWDTNRLIYWINRCTNAITVSILKH